MIPVSAEDPAALGLRRGVGGKPLGEVLFRDRRAQVDADELVGAADQVHMGVVETGQQQPAARVDDLSPGIADGADLLVGSDAGDAIGADCDRLRGRPGGIDSVDPGVDDSEVGDARLPPAPNPGSSTLIEKIVIAV